MARLQDCLALATWAAGKFGSSGIAELGGALRDQREDWGTDARTHFFRVLEGLDGLELAVDQLALYDERIQDYVGRLNANRLTPIRLKYFQYLGALVAELFLDRYFGDRAALLAELNEHVGRRNAGARSRRDAWPSFADDDLRKVAFWMATGSGKTLLMHINLWQYLHYCPPELRPQNILLITPNYGLSLQHLRELQASGIDARGFGDAEGMTLFAQSPITVIEITKLVETKRGGGLTVAVDAFGEDNLLLVDEAHRGASGDRWRELRRQLGDSGFTFEYSATFGQIVNGAAPAARAALLDEYGKSILFDYSYSHFYADGYGKDYRVLNLRGGSDEFDDTVVLANALGFVEQRLAFARERARLHPYNVEPPLWVFVGHTVSGTTRADRATLSDVQRLALFFERFLSDRAAAVGSIASLLEGRSELVDAEGLDIFRGSFAYLRRAGLRPDEIFDLLLAQVFNASAPARLRASVVERGDGELGLRVGHEPYFGVVNVGDLKPLVELLESRGVAVDADRMTPSLFETINHPDSGTNVLIGSRKFMEGWDSFRVASLGIMNIGRNEGSQIVQLFGRGVRLWGRDYSLKRTHETPTDVDPLALRTLETLGVYGVRADYMQQFRSYLEQEAIPTEFEVLTLTPKPSAEPLDDLLIPAYRDGPSFAEARVVKLAPDEEVSVSLDLRPRVEEEVSSGGTSVTPGRLTGQDRIGELRRLSPLLDWRRVFAEFEAFRVGKELWNLAASLDALRRLFHDGKIEVLASAPLRPGSPADVRRLEDVVASALRKYAASLYELARRRWEREQVTLVPLTASHPNIDFGGYALKVDTSRPDRLREISELIADGKKLYERDQAALPSIAWKRHLYQPLVVADPTKAVLSSMPPELNAGEATLLRDLRRFVDENPGSLGERRLFCLRNLTRGRGVPFFDPVGGDAFFPDFILWLLDGEHQSLGFLDPHGLRHALGGFDDPKITLRTHLQEVGRALTRSGVADVALTSIIVSTSPHETIRRVFGGASRDEFADHNVLFPEDDGYVEKLLGLLAA